MKPNNEMTTYDPSPTISIKTLEKPLTSLCSSPVLSPASP